MSFPPRSSLRRAVAGPGVVVAALLASLAGLAPAAEDRGTPVQVGIDARLGYTIDPASVQANGQLVRYHLSGHGLANADSYQAEVVVDCAAHTRRELSAESHDHLLGSQTFAPDPRMHDVPRGSRLDTELRQACRLATGAGHATLSPAAAALAASVPVFVTHSPTGDNVELGIRPARLPPGKPHAAAAAADLQAAGTLDRVDYAIVVDSVRREGKVTSYDLQQVVPGFAFTTWQHVVVDCDARLRAIAPEDAAPGTQLKATRVGGGSRADRELTLACALPAGPRKAWFAGFVVSGDGYVVAPHARTSGCTSLHTAGPHPRVLQPIGDEDDISVFKIQGRGPWTPMPAVRLSPSLDHVRVTVLGVFGTAPRVGAAYAEMAGANARDTGWPQVRTLNSQALREGIVWGNDGAALGLALGQADIATGAGHVDVRMLTSAMIRERLARHGIDWALSFEGRPDEESAMRMAVAATLPLACDHAR